MNFETGTSLVTMAFDMYCTTAPAAPGGRRGLGTVKSWQKAWTNSGKKRKGRGAQKDCNQCKRLGLCGAQGGRKTEGPGVHPPNRHSGERDTGLVPE